MGPVCVEDEEKVGADPCVGPFRMVARSGRTHGSAPTMGMSGGADVNVLHGPTDQFHKLDFLCYQVVRCERKGNYVALERQGCSGDRFVASLLATSIGRAWLSLVGAHLCVRPLAAGQGKPCLYGQFRRRAVLRMISLGRHIGRPLRPSRPGGGITVHPGRPRVSRTRGSRRRSRGRLGGL